MGFLKWLLTVVLVAATSTGGTYIRERKSILRDNHQTANEALKFKSVVNVLPVGGNHKNVSVLFNTKARNSTRGTDNVSGHVRTRTKRFIILKILCHLFQWKKCARRGAPLPPPPPPPPPPPVPVPVPRSPPVIIQGPFPPPVPFAFPGPLPPPVPVPVMG